MKFFQKTICLLLSFIFLILVCPQSYPSTQTSPPVDNRVHTVELLSESTLESYDASLTSFSKQSTGFTFSGTKKTSISDIINIEYVDTAEEYVDLEFVAQYVNSTNTVNLSTSNNTLDYSEAVSFSPVFSDTQFDGSIVIDGIEYNIFEIEDSLSNDKTESCGFFTITCLGIALWKIIAAVAVTTVAVTMIAYPEFYVKGLQKIGNAIEQSATCILENIKYNFSNITSKHIASTIELIQANRLINDRNIYYLAIPITKENVSKYDNVVVGDMLFSSYPVNYTTAKKAVQKGYSIYSFLPVDSYRVLKNAWANSYVKDEPCNSGFSIGYYSHYHAYYKVLGKLYKRYITLDGVSVSIHGFYGFPW